MDRYDSIWLWIEFDCCTQWQHKNPKKILKNLKNPKKFAKIQENPPRSPKSKKIQRNSKNLKKSKKIQEIRIFKIISWFYWPTEQKCWNVNFAASLRQWNLRLSKFCFDMSAVSATTLRNTRPGLDPLISAATLQTRTFSLDGGRSRDPDQSHLEQVSEKQKGPFCNKRQNEVPVKGAVTRTLFRTALRRPSPKIWTNWSYSI